jgi:hypothetical protein
MLSQSKWKKIIAGMLAFTAMSLNLSASADATTGTAAVGASPDYLQEIATFTNGTLTAVNSLPAYLTIIAESCEAWLQPDTTDTTANLQASFSNYSNAILASSAQQLQFVAPLTSDMFGSGVTQGSLPYANDLTYGTLLGMPYFTPDPRTANGGTAPNSPYNYLKYASGIGLTHTVPGTNWAGNAGDQTRYANYYNTVLAVESYNSYVLTSLLTNAPLTLVQTLLLTQASTSDFFSKIASEPVGAVLRQILMYDSQTYVVLTQLLSTEKQLLASQAMTNTLIMNTSEFDESMLLRKAIVKVNS